VAVTALPASTIFAFIVNDFESAWEAVVARPGHLSGRGNFMFALQAMILLEFACRLCAEDNTNHKLADLTKALTKLEPRYFTELPGPCALARGFKLPGTDPERKLLAMLNGKAHQYQSPIIKLADGDVDIDLTGAVPGRSLIRTGRQRPRNHLRYKVSSGDLSLYVRTDQLFLDIKMAIENSGIISPTDVVDHIARPRKKGSQVTRPPLLYDFKVAHLESCLDSGNHPKGTW
jgi:hypothetical protein